jgi:hypothetical protein
LQNFISVNKKIPSQSAKNEEEKKLGIWCNSLRGIRRKNKMLKINIEKLELLSGWYWDKND